ncbi:MAG: AAA family ATPase [Actinomycetota bacterium]
MRFRQVEAVAFGPLADQRLEFAPGMNVFGGPNESGKSSWQAAVYAALCGRRRGRGRAPEEEQEFEQLHKPWDGNRWEVRCLVEMDDGRRIELRHELNERVKCAAIDTTTGADLSASIMYDGAPDGSRLLGLNRQIMRPTLFVGQADILAVVDGSGSLQECMQRAASAGGGDATARKALAALAKFEENSIGGERARTKPLLMARQACDTTAGELAEARRHHEEYRQRARELDEALARVEALEVERQRVEIQRARAELAQVEERLGKIRPLAGDFAAGPPPEPAKQSRAVAAVTQALAEWRAVPAPSGVLEGPSTQELEAELGGLPDLPQGDLTPAAEVEAAYQTLTGARRDLQAVREAEGPEVVPAVVEGTTPTELRELAGALDRQAGASRSARRSSRPVGLAAIAGLVLAVVGAVVLVVGPALVGGTLIAVGALAALGSGLLLLVRREVSSQLPAEADAEVVFRRLRQLGVPADPAELRRVANELDRFLGAGVEGERRIARLRQLETQASTAAVALAGLLNQRGEAVSAEDPDGSYTRYREACRERQSRAALASRRSLLERQLGMRRQQEEQWTSGLQRISNAEARLRVAAAAAGLSAEGSTDELALRLDEWSTVTEQQAAAGLAAWKGYQELQGLLDGRSAADWEERAEAIRQQLAAAGPSPEPERGPSRAPEQLENELQAARAYANQLKGSLNNMKAGLADLAALEEAAGRAEQEVKRVESLAAVVRKTVGYLSRAEESVHRTIAPKLKAAIESWLPAITMGRYQEATVDPQDLTVRVRARGGDLRLATALSHGTAEQIYLLLRVALAEHLVTNGESAPLILDDVTIQSDAARSTAILELLHELSRDRQIIFFSQEDDVALWSEANLLPPNDRFQRLEALAPR